MLAPSTSIDNRVKPFGCARVVRLDCDTASPDQIDYLDLLPRRGVPPLPIPVAAVAEHQGTALLYLVDACTDADLSDVSLLQRKLANRSDPAWLGVARPGTLEIYPIDFRACAGAPLTVFNDRDEAAPLFFQSLVHGTLDVGRRPEAADYVYRRIFDLLVKTVEVFLADGAPEPLHVLSLAGRALFFRFLIDRAIVLPEDMEQCCPAAHDLRDTFSDPERAAQTSSWLDATFNGDLLQLIDESIPARDRQSRQREYQALFDQLASQTKGKLFRHLEAILRGWKYVGDHEFQVEFDWGDLDFAYIPIGVLSQVYESFSHLVSPQAARKESVHYTPRGLAKLMVDETFAALEHPAEALVLDPACGGGIFLGLAFRRLVRERWQKDGIRPDTGVIREILYHQLQGLEISEPALRLTALTLYFTAIEMDDSPRPPEGLRFSRALRGQVLHHVGDQDDGGPTNPANTRTGAYQLGSLRDDLVARYRARFDIVLGNPPWTRLREEERQRVDENRTETAKPGKTPSDLLNAAFTEVGRQALQERGLHALATDYENPDKNPDLPFFWRATQWAKGGGLIALALHARVFQRTSGLGAQAWNVILSTVSITGLINGADLRKTAVWDGIDVPFCLLFVRNIPPGPAHHFHYVTPSWEPRLNQKGRFRIDYEAGRSIDVELVKEAPWVLKALSLGTWRDVDLMKQVLDAFPQTLGQYWAEWDPAGVRTGKGYDLSPGLKQKDAGFLAELKDFKRFEGAVDIPFDRLGTFFENHRRRTAYWPKQKKLYQPPLVIIPQSPGADPALPRAYRSLTEPVAFSQSYYGYSCAEHPEQSTLSALLYLLPQSVLFAWFSLLSSRRAGFDRQTFNKEEFDAIPFPNIAALDPAVQGRIKALAAQFEHSPQSTRPEVDAFLFRLYGFDERDVQVAKDTLFSAVSYRKQGRKALEPASREDRARFADELGTFLEPFFEVCGHHVAVRVPDFKQDVSAAWCFLTTSREDGRVSVSHDLLLEAMLAADKRSASRIVVRAPAERGLLVGILNQKRWWTQTRARLVGQYILRSHLDVFSLAEGV